MSLSCNRYEFRSNHEEWINTEKPILEPDFSAQMNEIMKISEAEIELCKSIREEMRLALNSLLKVFFLKMVHFEFKY